MTAGTLIHVLLVPAV